MSKTLMGVGRRYVGFFANIFGSIVNFTKNCSAHYAIYYFLNLLFTYGHKFCTMTFCTNTRDLNVLFLPRTQKYQNQHQIVNIISVLRLPFNNPECMLSLFNCINIQAKQYRCNRIQGKSIADKIHTMRPVFVSTLHTLTNNP